MFTCSSDSVIVFTSCPILFFLNCGRNHKEDVKAVLQSEAGLVEEIDYDLRRFQKAEQERKQKAKVRLASSWLYLYMVMVVKCAASITM